MAPTRSPRGALISLGYEGRTLDEFLDLVRVTAVEVLVDVRQSAVSRKAGFSKRRLAEALEAEGVGYRHEPGLGNPKDNRDAFRRGSAAARRRYQRHLDRSSALVDEIAELATRCRVALLCIEQDEARCHRSCIIERVEQAIPGIPVIRPSAAGPE